MNRNQMKLIAVAAMVLDHIAVIFLTQETALWVAFRTLGRITAPVMCFFLSEGFIHTSSSRKYLYRLGFFALISQVPYALAFREVMEWWHPNVMYTLFISLLCLHVHKFRKSQDAVLILAGLFALTILADWGIIGPLYVMTFYAAGTIKPLIRMPGFMSRTTPLRFRQVYSFTIVSMIMLAAEYLSAHKTGLPIYTQLYECGIFLFIPLLLAYDGKPGSRGPVAKWGFYVFYPLHLFILAGIRMAVH
ncbi:MAG: hypothetical protein IKE03_05820 [Blautia sp.]|nr:hypothetical protein [Blautia sp.]